MAIDVLGIIKKAAEKSGFIRESHNDDNIPTNISKVTVVAFFGDIRSLFVLSSMLLNRFCEEERGSKYVILCSWPGYESLFPYVDEYWGIEDENIAKELYGGVCGFDNKHPQVVNFYRNLNQYFFEDLVIPAEHFAAVYKNGITDEFWQKYRHVKRALPGVPSAAYLGKEFNRELAARGGFKIFIYPSLYLSLWRFKEISLLNSPKSFWIFLVNRLLDSGYVPVVYKGALTHDISIDLTNKCINVTENDAGKVLSMMRATGCVLDLFSGISRLALAARCPFLCVDERSRYSFLKEYEIDDLCGLLVPKQYIFSFPTIIEGGGPESWDFNIVDNIIARLNAFLPTLDRDYWPTTGESNEIVLYDTVRKRKSRRIGARLLKLPKD